MDMVQRCILWYGRPIARVSHRQMASCTYGMPIAAKTFSPMQDLKVPSTAWDGRPMAHVSCQPGRMAPRRYGTHSPANGCLLTGATVQPYSVPRCRPMVHASPQEDLTGRCTYGMHALAKHFSPIASIKMLLLLSPGQPMVGAWHGAGRIRQCRYGMPVRANICSPITGSPTRFTP